MKLRSMAVSSLVILAIGVIGTAYAEETRTFAFAGIPGSDVSSMGIGASQFFLDVTPLPDNQALFTVRNIGPSPSSVTGFFIDDVGTDENDARRVIAGFPNAIITQEGVRFVGPNAAVPFPLAEDALPAFVATRGLTLLAPTTAQGVNPGESLQVVANLNENTNLAEFLARLRTGQVRVGLTTEGFSNGGSASFVNLATPIPAPAAIVLGSLGAAFVGWLRRRKML